MVCGVGTYYPPEAGIFGVGDVNKNTAPGLCVVDPILIFAFRAYRRIDRTGGPRFVAVCCRTGFSMCVRVAKGGEELQGRFPRAIQMFLEAPFASGDGGRGRAAPRFGFCVGLLPLLFLRECHSWIFLLKEARNMGGASERGVSSSI